MLKGKVISFDMSKALQGEAKISNLRTKHVKFVNDMMARKFESKGMLSPKKLSEEISSWLNKDVSHIVEGSGSVIKNYNEGKELFIEMQVLAKRKALLNVGGAEYKMNAVETEAIEGALKVYAEDYLLSVLGDAETRLKVVAKLTTKAEVEEVAKLVKA